MTKFSTIATALAVAASLTMSVVLEQRAEARLGRQNARRQQQAAQLAQLSAQNEGLSNLIAQLRSAQSLSKDQLKELLRLRNEAGRIRLSAQEKVKLQATNAVLRGVKAKAEQQLAEAQASANYWPKDQLSFAGRADPASALKSMLAAMNSGDVSAWRANCTPEAVSNMEREWTQRGLSAAQQDAEIKSMSEMLLSSSVGFHILDENLTSDNRAVVNLSFDGEGTARKFVLRKVGGEWMFDDLLVAGQDDPRAP
jgi:5'-3' exonuclease